MCNAFPLCSQSAARGQIVSTAQHWNINMTQSFIPSSRQTLTFLYPCFNTGITIHQNILFLLLVRLKRILVCVFLGEFVLILHELGVITKIICGEMHSQRSYQIRQFSNMIVFKDDSFQGQKGGRLNKGPLCGSVRQFSKCISTPGDQLANLTIFHG